MRCCPNTGAAEGIRRPLFGSSGIRPIGRLEKGTPCGGKPQGVLKKRGRYNCTKLCSRISFLYVSLPDNLIIPDAPGKVLNGLQTFCESTVNGRQKKSAVSGRAHRGSRKSQNQPNISSPLLNSKAGWQSNLTAPTQMPGPTAFLIRAMPS